jgi:aminopeptidase N
MLGAKAAGVQDGGTRRRYHRAMMLSGALVLLAALAGASGPSSTGADDAWVMERLDLEVTVDPVVPRLTVAGRMSVRLDGATSHGPTLALAAPDHVIRFREVWAPGAAVAIAPDAADAAVELARLSRPRAFRKGDRLEVAFALENAGESSQIRRGAAAFYASWAQDWYPTLYGPAVSPAAPGSTTLRMPESWRSVSNGVLASSSVVDGRRVERWTTDVAVARSFAAAPFLEPRAVESHGRRVSFHLVRPRANAEAQASALAQALDVMETRFGPFPYRRFDVVEVPEDAKFAASSEQGFILVRASVLDDARATLPLFAHEAAHGWWGNLVRSEDVPGGKMVSEALAQYGAVLSIESLEGAAARDEFLRFSRPGYSPVQCALGYFHVWREGGDKPLSQLGDARWDHTLSDSKGMWFWHMLRGRLGDEAFFAELRAVVQDFASRPLSLDALRERFVRRDATLAPFLAQWLDRAGVPVLRVDWWSVDRGRGVEIHVDQLQDVPAFVFPLEVAVTTAGGEGVRQTFEVTEKNHAFTIATPSRALDVRLDPEHRVLMWRPEYGPRP